VPEVIAEEHAGQVDVVKLNVDENPAPAQEYGIMLVPTLAVFPGGEVVRRVVGERAQHAVNQLTTRDSGRAWQFPVSASALSARIHSPSGLGQDRSIFRAIRGIVRGIGYWPARGERRPDPVMR